MSEILSQLIRNTKEYSDVCDMCKDEILIYPIISGRTKYTQDEVEQITLKRIIDKLQAKEQECEGLKAQIETVSTMLDSSEFRFALNDVRTGEREVWRKLGSKAQKYEQALDEIEKIISGNYETLDPLAKQQISNIISKIKRTVTNGE